MQEFLRLASRLADEARVIVKQYYRQNLDVISKDDASPVTIADRGVESRLRYIIEKERPEDGVFGEEFGIKDSKNGLSWVIDPIDGTKSFIIGRPTFGTLIALCKDGVPILGVIDQPISGERWMGAEGLPTTFNGHPVKTRPCASVAEAVSGSTTPAMYSETGPKYQVFEDQGKAMIWGGDCYMYGLLACGWMDIIIEASLKPYDFAAVVPVVQGAGGLMTDWQGKALTLESSGEILACGDRSLHEAALKLIA
ncbi:MAG: histidinol phosphate phosphatase [Alphaproteobacteria bacterium]|nr:histidinol phosphate phosphatase [Alphaproteobacteria bacterium]MCD8520206.1 histidinol phosphate phosphatase [Alphaproteobacteria bacterium]MCD8570984.1 histidinol phosphate phosphatase [Alphaproteobacteria bacterium]